MAFLDEILEKKEAEIALSKRKHNIGDLKRMFKDAPPLRSFSGALNRGFGIIAEIKAKSPSVGNMQAQNVADAPNAYNRSPIVKAVSVLTDSHFFGMNIGELERVKSLVRQPILRKDFIVKEHQIYEARAYGADAVLIMANVLDKESMRRMYDIVLETGMEALFEAHTEEEIESIPSDAHIFGLNSRKFMAQKRWVVQKWISRHKWLSKVFPWWSGKTPDLSLDMNIFRLIGKLPEQAIKIAESGVKPAKIGQYKNMGFNAALVGTSLLSDQRGIRPVLSEFESALEEPKIEPAPEMAHVVS